MGGRVPMLLTVRGIALVATPLAVRAMPVGKRASRDRTPCSRAWPRAAEDVASLAGGESGCDAGHEGTAVTPEARRATSRTVLAWTRGDGGIPTIVLRSNGRMSNGPSTIRRKPPLGSSASAGRLPDGSFDGPAGIALRLTPREAPVTSNLASAGSGGGVGCAGRGTPAEVFTDDPSTRTGERPCPATCRTRLRTGQIFTAFR